MCFFVFLRKFYEKIMKILLKKMKKNYKIHINFIYIKNM